jgi:hypothetical protein
MITAPPNKTRLLVPVSRAAEGMHPRAYERLCLRYGKPRCTRSKNSPFSGAIEASRRPTPHSHRGPTGEGVLGMTVAKNVETLLQPRGGNYEVARFNALRYGVLSQYAVLPWKTVPNTVR